MRKIAWCLLLGHDVVAITPAAALAVTPRPAVAPIAAIEAVATVEAATTALIAFAIPVRLAHHRRGTFFMFVDAYREVAQDVLAQTLLALHLGDGRGRRIEPEQGEMRLAVLLDTERERLDAPIFRRVDQFAAEAFDHRLIGVGHFLDLLRAQVLARQIDVFIQRHAYAFPLSVARPAPSPSCPREGRESSQEGGNTGRRAMQPYRPKRAGRPFSSRPGSSGERGLYPDFALAQPQKRAGWAPPNRLRTPAGSQARHFTGQTGGGRLRAWEPGTA